VTRPRIPLYDFLPYGAPELLEVRESYLTRALTTATLTPVVAFLVAALIVARLPHAVPIALPPLPCPTPAHVIRPWAIPVPPHGNPIQRFHAWQGQIPVPVPPVEAPPPAPAQDETHGSDTQGQHPDVITPPSVDGPVEGGNPGLADFVFHDVEPGVAFTVLPLYPDMAREAGVEGTVLLRVLVGRDGHVKDVHVDRSIPLLDDAATDAVRQWVFTPALATGHPVAVWVSVPIRFRLH
jgi:protein TonB